MAVKILEVKIEKCPAARLIGKKYNGRANWDEWWQNDWFTALEANKCLPFNGDAYIGAVHIVNGMPERWIGMLFPADTEVPEGFEYADIKPLDYAVCYLYDRENSGDFYTLDTHNMCLEELKVHNLKRKEDDWCFERYNCPRFTTPDEAGNVILDYAVSIESEDFLELKEQIIKEFNSLGIEDMPEITDLSQLKGSYVNLEYELLNGQTVKLLDDNKVYLGYQIEKINSDRCYGLVADDRYLLVCEYAGNCAQPEIVVYKRR